MNIIDEKGRLFGLINLLDLIVLIGALIALYLGISVFLVLKSPPLKLVSVNPDRIEEGTSVPATAELINDRKIESASLRLIPHNFPGETVQLTCQSSKISNKQLLFTFPPDIKPGEYEVELEIAVADIFSRTSIHFDRLAGNYLTVEPKKVEVVEKPVEIPAEVVKKPEFDSNCLWELELSAVIPAGQLKRNMPLIAGDSLALGFQDIEARLIEIRKSTPEELRAMPVELRQAGAKTAKLTISTVYPVVDLFLRNSASQLILYRQEGSLTGFALNRASVVLDLIFYIEHNSQLAALKEGAREKSPEGRVRAEMLTLFGEIDNPWFKSSESRSSLKIQQIYQVARLKLACSVENGKLYYNKVPLEPNRLISFGFGGENIEGSVLINSPDYVDLKQNVLLSNLPQRLLPLLKPGIVIENPESGENLGYVLKVLDRDALDPESLMRPEVPDGLGELFSRALIQLSLNCTYINGNFYFNGVMVDYGNNLNFRILGTSINGTVWYESTLPPQRQPLWKEVVVEFGNVPPDVAELIHPGDSELALNGPVTKRIKSIVSIDSADIVIPNAEGIYVQSKHPLNRDIRCRMELYVSRAGELFFYNNSRLMIGMNLLFAGEHWSLNARLVDF